MILSDDYNSSMRIMSMIGRKKEQRILNDCLESKQAEFLVVYGRRRVGKTFLVKEFFSERFAFYATGVTSTKTGVKPLCG